MFQVFMIDVHMSKAVIECRNYFFQNSTLAEIVPLFQPPNIFPPPSKKSSSLRSSNLGKGRVTYAQFVEKLAETGQSAQEGIDLSNHGSLLLMISQQLPPNALPVALLSMLYLCHVCMHSRYTNAARLASSLFTTPSRLEFSCVCVRMVHHPQSAPEQHARSRSSCSCRFKQLPKPREINRENRESPISPFPYEDQNKGFGVLTISTTIS